MAEGWVRSLRSGQSVGVASAGIVAGTAIKPGASTVMAEAGVDIGPGGFNQTSDSVADFSPGDFDVVVSCCGCGDKLTAPWRDHPGFEDWNLDDPPATDPGDLSEYRRVRDECKAKVENLLGVLAGGANGAKKVMIEASPDSLVAEVEALVAANTVIMFSKTTCGYCTRAKKAIAEAGVKMKVVELNTSANGAAMQQALIMMTKQRTVPVVFVEGSFLGGCDDTLKALKTGRFKALQSQQGTGPTPGTKKAKSGPCSLQ